jgi:hypothetical protein
MNHLSNPSFLKTFRTTVQMFKDTTTGTNTFGRYYFDEIRELTGKNIVGFNVDAGDISALFQNNITNQDETVFINNAPLYVAELQLTLQNFYLNFYNENSELIIENFPCAAAFNYNEFKNYGALYPGLTGFYKFKNIIPLDTKINIRKSYIFGNFSALGIDNLGISVNFYYN